MILAKKFYNFSFKFLFEIEPEFRQYAVLDKKSLSLLKKIGFFQGVNPSFFWKSQKLSQQPSQLEQVFMWVKLTPLCNFARANSVCEFYTILLWLSVYIEKRDPCKRMTPPSQKGDPARRVTLLGKPRFQRNFMKSWLAQCCFGRGYQHFSE